jgi:hypothetical protein
MLRAVKGDDFPGKASSDSEQQNDHFFCFVKDGTIVYKGMVHCENDMEIFASTVAWNVPAELNNHFEAATGSPWLMYVNDRLEADCETTLLYDHDVIVFRYSTPSSMTQAEEATSSSASTSLAIPSGLMAGFTPKAEEKAESEGTDDHEESTDDHGDITMNKILQAIKDSELRIIAEVRKTIQLTKVKTFVFEDDDNHGMTCNQTSSTDICFYIMRFV